jgi:hypothetical protein
MLPLTAAIRRAAAMPPLREGALLLAPLRGVRRESGAAEALRAALATLDVADSVSGGPIKPADSTRGRSERNTTRPSSDVIDEDEGRARAQCLTDQRRS